MSHLKSCLGGEKNKSNERYDKTSVNNEARKRSLLTRVAKWLWSQILSPPYLPWITWNYKLSQNGLLLSGPNLRHSHRQLRLPSITETCRSDNQIQICYEDPHLVPLRWWNPKRSMSTIYTMQASDALQTKSFDEWSDVGDSVAVYVLQQCEKWKIIDESVDDHG